MAFQIIICANNGVETTQDASDLEGALKVAKSVRTQANRRVEISGAEGVSHRWDRPHVIGENRWRKVHPGEMRILGAPAPIYIERRPRKV